MKHHIRNRVTAEFDWFDDVMFEQFGEDAVWQIDKCFKHEQFEVKPGVPITEVEALVRKLYPGARSLTFVISKDKANKYNGRKKRRSRK